MISTLLAASALAAPQSTPIVDLASLMSIPMETAKGILYPDDIQVAFVPAGAKAEVALLKDGAEQQKFAMTIYQSNDSPVIFFLKPGSFTDHFQVTADGSYQVSVRVNGSEVGSLPFTAKKAQSGDAFNPKVSWRFTGPQAKYGFLGVQSKRTGSDPLTLWIWGHRDEWGNKPGEIKVSVVVGGKTVAMHSGNNFYDFDDWRRMGINLRKDANNTFKLADLLALKGAGTITVTANGKPIRVFPFEVKGGEFVRLPENNVSFSPASKVLLPKLVAPDDRKMGLAEAFWLRAK